MSAVKVSGTSESGNVYSFWLVTFVTFLNVAICLQRWRPITSRLVLLLINLATGALVVASASRGGTVYYIVSILLTYAVVVTSGRSLPWARIATHFAIIYCLGIGLGVLTMMYDFGLHTQQVPLFAKMEEAGEDPRWLFATYTWEVLQHVDIFLFGAGFDAFYPALIAYDIDLADHVRYGDVDFAEFTPGPHNIFLNAIAEGGVFFFIGIIELFAATPIVALMAMRKPENRGLYPALAFALICVASMVVALSSEDFTFHAPIFFFALLPFAMASSAIAVSQRRPVALQRSARAAQAGNAAAWPSQPFRKSVRIGGSHG